MRHDPPAHPPLPPVDGSVANRPVVVAVTGAPGAQELVARAAAIAGEARTTLIAVHVRPPASVDRAAGLEEVRATLDDQGASYREIVGHDPAARLVEFAIAEGALQLIVGAANPSRWQRLVGRSSVAEVVRLAGSIDVLVVAGSGSPPHRPAAIRRNRPTAGLPARRRLLGWMAAAIGLPLVIALLVIERRDISLSADLLILLLVIIGVAAIGGRAPAVVGAIAAFLMANWYLTPPYHRWEISRRESLIALIVFVATAVIVSSFVSSTIRRDAEAQRARAEAETLARLATTFSQEDPIGTLVDHLRSTFTLDGVAVLERGGTGEWVATASSGRAPTNPREANVVESLGDGVVLALRGPGLSADDRRVVHAFASQLSATLERSRLAAAARRAAALEQANALRDALLQAVSHDLRTPLAGIKAAVSSLRDPEIEWPEEERQDFLATIESETDRLTALVSNLLDLSRLHAGELPVNIQAVAIEEVVPTAIHSVGAAARRVQFDSPAAAVDLAADRALLERVVANLVANALKFSPPGEVVTVGVVTNENTTEIHVIDHGPGIPVTERATARLPFRRLGDRESTVGVGLGLAIADGFTKAQGGELELTETSGGGLTAVVRLPVWNG